MPMRLPIGIGSMPAFYQQPSGMQAITIPMMATTGLYGPHQLEQLFQTEIQYMEAMEETEKRLLEADSLRKLRVAQQDTFGVAQLLRARQLLYDQQALAATQSLHPPTLTSTQPSAQPQTASVQTIHPPTVATRTGGAAASTLTGTRSVTPGTGTSRSRSSQTASARVAGNKGVPKKEHHPERKEKPDSHAKVSSDVETPSDAVRPGGIL